MKQFPVLLATLLWTVSVFAALGSEQRLDDAWNRNIDSVQPDAGILWWLEFVREN